MNHKRKQFLLTIAIALLGMTSASGQQFYDKDYVGSHFPIGWKPYIDHSIRILSGIDNDKSKEWAVNTLTVIVEKGASPYAMNCLGVAYMEGLGVEPDSAKAISLLEKAARGGNNSGYVNLGMIYHMGKCGVKQDYKKAYDYYSKGARKGSAYCRYCKGFLLFNGLGCKQDYKKTVRCFRRSANERHVSSIYMRRSWGQVFDS